MRWDSVGEVIRFEKNAAHSVDPDVLGGDIDLLDLSVLFAADNVDHNIITIDGKGTFHGMGIVAAVTPGQRTNRLIPRRNISELKTAENKTKIPILEYRFAKHACREVVFQEFPRFVDCDRRIDILWEVSLRFKQATPNWQGMMHILHQGKSAQMDYLKGDCSFVGVFSHLVNLLGALGKLMEGTGLKNILETVYGEHDVWKGCPEITPWPSSCRQMPS